MRLSLLVTLSKSDTAIPPVPVATALDMINFVV